MSDNGNILIKSVEPKPAQVATEVVTFVNESIFNLVKDLSEDPQNEVAAPTDLKKVLSKESVDAEMKEGFPSLQIRLGEVIRFAYSVSYTIASKVAKEVAANTKKQFAKKKLPVALSGPQKAKQRLQKQLLTAFSQLEYRGEAHKSSGFGKSRMLYKVALDTSKKQAHDFEMRVLYNVMCGGKQPASVFPSPTNQLDQWLFPPDQTETKMTETLVAIYRYARSNWRKVGEEWTQTFTIKGADGSVADCLEKYLKSKFTPASKSATQLGQIPGGSSNQSRRGMKVVVLVIDEARALLSRETEGVSYFCLLCRALTAANKEIGSVSGIFAVLVDSKFKEPGLRRPTALKLDSTSRNWESNPWATLPPFVLTHTNDLYWRDELAREGTCVFSEDEDVPARAYRSAVLGKNEHELWNALLGMGRPLWASTFRAVVREYDNAAEAVSPIEMSYMKTHHPIDAVLNLAACKLLPGLVPWSAVGYCESTMFGVASMLCRLGMRPYPWSALASRVVADFMAILSYVNYHQDAFVSSYGTDPVLALGATRVWHSLENGLPSHIIPQFKKLVLNKVLDMDNVGEVVARIVLLLVMDSGVVMESEAKFGERKIYSTFNLTGQFVGVPSFLKLLVGVDPKVMKTEALEALEDVRSAYLDWTTKWKSWKMGFCQFIQLEKEPTEDTLWFLLARRAAGVLPRDLKGADLVIPIFREAQSEMGMEAEVSVMLVRVKNVKHGDKHFPMSAGEEMSPNCVFSAGNALRDKFPADMIRVYFSLQEEINIGDSRRFVYSYIDKSWQMEVDNDQNPKGNTQESGSSQDQLLETHRENIENLYEHDRSDDEMKDLQRPSKKRKTNAKTSSSITRSTNHEASSNGSEIKSTSTQDAVTSPSLTFCIRSLEKWPSIVGRSTHSPVSPSVAEKLIDLAKSRWTSMDYIARDMKNRSQDKVFLEGTPDVLSEAQAQVTVRRGVTPAPSFGDN